MKNLIGERWPYQAKVARDNGLALVMYEGGSHVTGVGRWANNETLTAYFSAFQQARNWLVSMTIYWTPGATSAGAASMRSTMWARPASGAAGGICAISGTTPRGMGP